MYANQRRGRLEMFEEKERERGRRETRKTTTPKEVLKKRVLNNVTSFERERKC